MGWKEVAAGLGTETTVSALKAVEGQVSKRRYKRLIATAVAQLLVLHPDIGPKKARRRAKRLTGARPSKKLLRAADGLGLKEGAEGAVAAAATAGVVKVASVVGEKLKRSVRARRSHGAKAPGRASTDHQPDDHQPDESGSPAS